MLYRQLIRSRHRVITFVPATVMPACPIAPSAQLLSVSILKQLSAILSRTLTFLLYSKVYSIGLCSLNLILVSLAVIL